MGTTLLSIGVFVFLVANVWLVVLGFRKSLTWGLVCLFLPGVSLLFAIVVFHWDLAARPFLIGVVGVALAVGGVSYLARDAKVREPALTIHTASP